MMCSHLSFPSLICFFLNIFNVTQTDIASQAMLVESMIDFIQFNHRKIILSAGCFKLLKCFLGGEMALNVLHTSEKVVMLPDFVWHLFEPRITMDFDNIDLIWVICKKLALKIFKCRRSTFEMHFQVSYLGIQRTLVSHTILF